MAIDEKQWASVREAFVYWANKRKANSVRSYASVREAIIALANNESKYTDGGSSSLDGLFTIVYTTDENDNEIIDYAIGNEVFLWAKDLKILTKRAADLFNETRYTDDPYVIQNTDIINITDLLRHLILEDITPEPEETEETEGTEGTEEPENNSEGGEEEEEPQRILRIRAFEVQGLYSDGYVSARGVDNAASNSGSIDADDIWDILGDPGEGEQINVAHLADLQQWVTTNFYLKNGPENLVSENDLLTNYTIWGQRFQADNGDLTQKIIIGDMSRVGNITMSGSIRMGQNGSIVLGPVTNYLNSNVGFYSNSFISSRGLDPTMAYGGSDFDENDMWDALALNDATHKIHNSHLNSDVVTTSVLNNRLESYLTANDLEVELNNYTIWGQHFNNKTITGDMTSVGNITMSGAITFGTNSGITLGSSNGNLHTGVGFYADTFISARGVDNTPIYGSDFDEEDMWMELGRDDNTKIIHSSHISGFVKTSELNGAISLVVPSILQDYTVWGQRLVTTTVGDMTDVGNITMSGNVTMSSNSGIISGLSSLRFGSGSSTSISLVNSNINSSVGFYSTSFVSARGVDNTASSGGSDFDTDEMWEELATNDSTHKIHNSHLNSDVITSSVLNNILDDYLNINTLQAELNNYTIWGQHFNNKTITGSMSSVGDIGMIGDINYVTNLFFDSANNISLAAVNSALRSNAGLYSLAFISARGIDNTSASGSGAFNEDDMWDELERADSTKIIDNSHITGFVTNSELTQALSDVVTSTSLPTILQTYSVWGRPLTPVTNGDMTSVGSITMSGNITMGGSGIISGLSSLRFGSGTSESISLINSYFNSSVGFYSSAFLSARGLDNSAYNASSFDESDMWDLLTNTSSGHTINANLIPIGTGLTISGGVINATGSGGAVYAAGDGINIDTSQNPATINVKLYFSGSSNYSGLTFHTDNSDNSLMVNTGNGLMIDSGKVTINPKSNGGIAVDSSGVSISEATKDYLGGIKIAADKRTTAPNLKTGGTTDGRYYGVELDKNGKAFVNVPWTANTDDYVAQQYLTTYYTSYGQYPLLYSYFKNNSEGTPTSYITYFSSSFYIDFSSSGYNLVVPKINSYVLGSACEKSFTTSISANSTSVDLPTAAAVASFVSSQMQSFSDTWRPVSLWTGSAWSEKQSNATNSGNLKFKAGSNVTISYDTSNKCFEFSSTDTNTDTHYMAVLRLTASERSPNILEDNTTNPYLAILEGADLNNLIVNNSLHISGSGSVSVTGNGANLTISGTDTWTPMVGATSEGNGSVGYVNAIPPQDGYNTKYLRADGTWTVPPDTQYNAAEVETLGLIKINQKRIAQALDPIDLYQKSPLSGADTQRYYGVEIDTNGKAYVYVPWGSGGSYTEGDGISISDDAISVNSTVLRTDSILDPTKLDTEKIIPPECYTDIRFADFYGSCDTAAGTATKTTNVNYSRIVSSSELVKGFTAIIYHSTTTSVANPTLNIYNSGDKPVYYYNNGSLTRVTGSTGKWNQYDIIRWVYYPSFNNNGGGWLKESVLGNGQNHRLRLLTDKDCITGVSFNGTSASVSNGIAAISTDVVTSSDLDNYLSKTTSTAQSITSAVTVNNNLTVGATGSNGGKTTTLYGSLIIGTYASSGNRTVTLDAGYNTAYSGSTYLNINKSVVSSYKFYDTSDIRLKKNIKELTDALTAIENLPIVQYEYKSEEGHKYIGTLAQKLLPLYPELVAQDEKGYYSVDYGGLAAIAIQGLKELNNRVKELEEKLYGYST